MSQYIGLHVSYINTQIHKIYIYRYILTYTHVYIYTYMHTYILMMLHAKDIAMVSYRDERVILKPTYPCLSRSQQFILTTVEGT
jgi:hypothetical protein